MKWVGLVFLVLLVSSCSEQTNELYAHRTVSVDGSEFEVEVPLTQEGFTRGLMFREKMGHDGGMWFQYSEDSQRTFWMKNTLIPLDIIFINSSFEIVTIQNAVPCKEEPCALYPSNKPARYVLEINGGLAEELGIKVGDDVKLDSPDS